MTTIKQVPYSTKQPYTLRNVEGSVTTNDTAVINGTKYEVNSAVVNVNDISQLRTNAQLIVTALTNHINNTEPYGHAKVSDIKSGLCVPDIYGILDNLSSQVAALETYYKDIIEFLPVGSIVECTKKNAIPSGWEVCTGNHGTVDLVNHVPVVPSDSTDVISYTGIDNQVSTDKVYIERVSR